jgi:hypothetical protein
MQWGDESQVSLSIDAPSPEPSPEGSYEKHSAHRGLPRTSATARGFNDGRHPSRRRREPA